MKYAIFYNGMFWGTANHEHRVSDIKDARKLSREEAIAFIKKVPGAIARPIKTV